MENSDAMIRREDVKAVRRQIGDDGWGDAALAIFEREPLLGQCIAQRWACIRVMMMTNGLSESQAKPILRQIVMLIVESLGLQQRAKEKLIADFLPDTTSDTNNEKGDGHAS
jgi:hypothetical protein